MLAWAEIADPGCVFPAWGPFLGAKHRAQPFLSNPRFLRGNETIYLHRSGPLLENGLDRPKNRYGRYERRQKFIT